MANIEDELLDLERRFWQAIKNKDGETAMRLTDDRCVVAGAQGVAQLDRAVMGPMFQSATFTLHDCRIDHAEVPRLRDDVAVVAYRVREELTVDGKPLKLDAADAPTWIRRRGGWVCALHTESILGDPYGRK